ncbi:MAG: tRNA dihydrouridine(20/20a) synthase DusA [Gammaproteobacteria bacterium]|nr:tRNA dihydrouridine(20/20a) synthase DusA [Gammaproteobacteria bacterium]MCW9056710.1 tRNA dihydrouridine(20/20a) synthase DusA [Gammaproteobacteria bacterium]
MSSNHIFSIAPMLDWTDRHDRYFLRLITRHSFLYTEMITTGALLHGDVDRFLSFNDAEHPVSLQLGGSHPGDLAASAKIGQQYGYDEINLNVGCPSERVKSGSFGACLMAEPKLVADCVDAMKSSVDIPVTVKHRIGIDDRDSWDELCEFIEVVSNAGCQLFIVHARKAWLQGLSPKQNREIPPLKYETVYKLKKEYPHLEFVINGGIKSIAEAEQHLNFVDGVMMGREAYHNPYVLAEVDSRLYSDKNNILSRKQILEKLIPYVEDELAKGTRLHSITRHIMGLFLGVPGAKAWRRHLSENGVKANASINVLHEAFQKIDSDL